MYETNEDLADLQRVLDESYESAGEHLRSLFPPKRRASARDIVAALRSVFMINLATVTAACKPLVAPVDGMIYRGRLWFSLPPGALRARHLRARPQVSATYVQGDPGACLIVHGDAVRIDEEHPFFTGFDAFARELYGVAVDVAQARHRDRNAPDFTGFVQPRRIYAQDFPVA